MVKKKLAIIVARLNNLPAKQVETILNDAIHIIQTTLSRGEKVQFIGFGTFQVKTRKARTVLNPRTGEPMEIPASKLPTFTAGKSFKAVVNES